MKEPDERRSAGLPLSVGSASFGVRLTVSLVFLIAALACSIGSALAAQTFVARVAVAVVVEPIGIAGFLAAAFIIAPHSRFGIWLDQFVTRLREPRVAVATAVAIWLAGAAIVLLAE